MLIKGFRFGMLLQLAIGPVCIFVFQIAALQGFFPAETSVLAVVLVDGVYIFAAIIGIASILTKPNVRMGLKIFSTLTLLIFGISMILSPFNINLIPSFNFQDNLFSDKAYLKAFILTASNPLTILFWAGVFSSKIVEYAMKGKEIYLFGFGALLSTFFFLSIIAFCGSFLQTFLSPLIVQIMNLLVGILLIYFAIKVCLKK